MLEEEGLLEQAQQQRPAEQAAGRQRSWELEQEQLPRERAQEQGQGPMSESEPPWEGGGRLASELLEQFQFQASSGRP